MMRFVWRIGVYIGAFIGMKKTTNIMSAVALHMIRLKNLSLRTAHALMNLKENKDDKDGDNKFKDIG